MLTLTFPFIPPTANHAQKHRLMGRRIVRYNTPQYNEFKQEVEKHLNELNEATRAELVALLAKPHGVFITIASPKFKTKKGEWSLTGGDVDNFCKPQFDAIYKPLQANDALIIMFGAKKKADDEEWTLITFTQYAEGTEGLLDVKQMAEYFTVSKSTVRKWVKDKKLKAFKIKNKLFFEPLYLESFSDER